MKKIAIVVALLAAFALLAGACAGGTSSAVETDPIDGTSAANAAPKSAADSESAEAAPDETAAAGASLVRIAGLKGPTAMGMAQMATDNPDKYELTVYGTADEVAPLLAKGELDAAAIPANLASILYNNTKGEIVTAAINTLGVLYVVETGDTVQSIEDLRGKTVYSVGKGTTPEFTLNYILAQNGMDPATDVTIEYKSESTEVAAMLATGGDVIAVLPQPYVTAVGMQNENVRVALDLTEEWDKVSDKSALVTGVLVVRKDFAEENPDALEQLLEDNAASVAFTNENPAAAAEMIAALGIVEKAPVAEKALPLCNIVFITGDEMQEKLSGYLEVLYGQNPKAVGETPPGDDFYLG